MPDGYVLPLVPLHADASLIASKLQQYDKHAYAEPGRVAKGPDGTILDGHHRLKILRDRGIEVHALDREIVRKESGVGTDEDE